MNKQRIAIPVSGNSGLNSMISGHFGRAPGFFVVNTDGTQAEYLISQEAKAASECAPITALARAGAKLVAAHSMGKGALQRCHQAGMQIYQTQAQRVVDLLADLEKGVLNDFPDSALCNHASGHHEHEEEHCHRDHE